MCNGDGNPLAGWLWMGAGVFGGGEPQGPWRSLASAHIYTLNCIHAHTGTFVLRVRFAKPRCTMVGLRRRPPPCFIHVPVPRAFSLLIMIHNHRKYYGGSLRERGIWSERPPQLGASRGGLPPPSPKKGGLTAALFSQSIAQLHREADMLLLELYV